MNYEQARQIGPNGPYDLGRVQLYRLDLVSARSRSHCDVPECPNWEDFRTLWPGGYISDSLCQEHATHATVVELHPFHPGLREIHPGLREIHS